MAGGSEIVLTNIESCGLCVTRLLKNFIKNKSTPSEDRPTVGPFFEE